MFEHIKLAFIDYDRTLYSHMYPACGEKHDTYYEECVRNLVYASQYNRFIGSKPLKCMQWFVSYLRDRGVEEYILTHEIFNLRDEWKKTTALNDYGISKYLTVNSPEHKIDMIKAVADTNGVNYRDCLFVDDKMEIVYLACEAGIFGLHTSNIVQLYEDMQN